MSSSLSDAPEGVDNSTPSDFTHLAVNLRVLGKLKAEEKLSRSGPYLVIDCQSYMTPLLRYLRSENRLQMIMELESLYSETLRIIKDSRTSKEWSDMLGRLVCESLCGITVLQQTYHADATVVSRPEQMLEIANAAIKKHSLTSTETRSF